jgi:hypothetical protein
MEVEEIIEKINIAIGVLFSNDNYLLRHDLNEKSITHKLAEHLQQLFLGFNVDCEYNGDIDKGEGGRKRISVLKSDLDNKGLLKVREIMETDNEFADRQVFPDIIIHKRGFNTHNLCIIEVKKTTSIVSPDYDLIKLKAYTSDIYGNDLKYKIGIFIIFATSREKMDYSIRYFINGQESRDFTG